MEVFSAINQSAFASAIVTEPPNLIQRLRKNTGPEELKLIKVVSATIVAWPDGSDSTIWAKEQ